jgi:hypothetical protein
MTVAEYNKEVIAYLQKKRIDALIVGECKSLKNPKLCMPAARRILKLSGISNKIIKAALVGIECEGYTTGSFTNEYDGIILEKCWDMGTKFIRGNTRCEIGFKHFKFPAELLIEKYGLTITGKFQPESNKGCSQYSVWENTDRTISFTFLRGKMGNGCGYGGAIFPSHESALECVQWLFKLDDFNFDNLNLFYNGLGAQNIREYDKQNLVV